MVLQEHTQKRRQCEKLRRKSTRVLHVRNQLKIFTLSFGTSLQGKDVGPDRKTVIVDKLPHIWPWYSGVYHHKLDGGVVGHRYPRCISKLCATEIPMPASSSLGLSISTCNELVYDLSIAHSCNGNRRTRLTSLLPSSAWPTPPYLLKQFSVSSLLPPASMYMPYHP